MQLYQTPKDSVPFHHCGASSIIPLTIIMDNCTEAENGYRASNSEGIMCVTGTWSFLGIDIARMLLRRGYSVRLAVPITAEETRSLMNCEEALSRNLVICEADLLDYYSVFSTIKGCCGVFHVPEPSDELDGFQHYPAERVDYQVQSALNVVEACAAAESVRRLVFTSSLSAIVCGKKSSEILDENCWTNLDFCHQKKLWSSLTKTLSEKAVWALSNDRGLNLVVLNLPLVIGSQGCEPDSHTILNYLKGSKAIQQNGVYAYIEVEEAAFAHLVAFECENATGRYICLQKVLTEDEVKEVQRSSHVTSNYRLEELMHPVNISNKKFLKLKRQYSGELA